MPDLAAWLEARFDVVYESDTSYHFLSHAAGLSFHKPEPFDKRRADESVIEERLARIREDIAADLTDPQTLVYAADEVRIDQEPILSRAWYARGAKTKLLVDRQRGAQNYIGFLNQNTGECELQRLDWQNAPLILDALHELVDAHPGKKITIVWDNASWHKTKLIRDQLGNRRTLAGVRLVSFPPYAPEIHHDHSAASRTSNPTTRPLGNSLTTIHRFPHRQRGTRHDKLRRATARDVSG